MDKKQQFNIPKYIWVIAGVLVVCIIYLIIVQVPFSQKLGTYNKDHASAQAQISMYGDYMARASEVSTEIVQMKEKYDKESQKLFVNGTKTSDDIRDMLKNLNYDPNELSVERGVPDTEGRVSSTGDPLYATVVRFNFTSSEEELISTLNYLESESKGSYYVTNISVQPADEEEESVQTAEEGSQASGEESSKPAASSAVSTQNSGTAGNGTKYEVELTISLYYFNPAANTGESSDESGESSDESSAA